MSLAPCVCGETRPPRVVRRGTASLLSSLECVRCKRRTPISRIEHLDLAWQTMQATLRRDADRQP